MSTKTSDYDGCVVGLISLLSMPFTMALRGWALSVLWVWFVVPTFRVAPLSVPYALGLSLTLGLFYVQRISLKTDPDKTTADGIAETLIYGFLHPLVALGIGWVVMRFAG